MPVKFGKLDKDPNNGFIYFLKPGDIYEWQDDGDWDGFHIAFHDELLKDYNVPLFVPEKFFASAVLKILKDFWHSDTN